MKKKKSADFVGGKKGGKNSPDFFCELHNQPNFVWRFCSLPCLTLTESCFFLILLLLGFNLFREMSVWSESNYLTNEMTRLVCQDAEDLDCNIDCCCRVAHGVNPQTAAVSKTLLGQVTLISRGLSCLSSVFPSCFLATMAPLVLPLIIH